MEKHKHRQIIDQGLSLMADASLPLDFGMMFSIPLFLFLTDFLMLNFLILILLKNCFMSNLITIILRCLVVFVIPFLDHLMITSYSLGLLFVPS